MIRHKRFAVKLICFCFVLFILVYKINCILIPKFYFNSLFPTTSGYKGFYQMKDNSIDVLFLGSSHAMSAFIPQEVYNSYGIRSYNLSCDAQNFLITYYWLKEALRFQSPQVVVIDTYMLYEYAHLEPLNTGEEYTRKAIESMKWSPVKWQAIHDIANHDERQTVNSYIFPNIRFHTRWKSLEEQDFRYSEIERHYELKGYAPLNAKSNYTDYAPFGDCEAEICKAMVPLMEEYLNRINDLCKENEIQLMLVKTPTTAWDYEEHNALCNYAINNDIYFCDFNDKEIYDACEFNFPEDMSDVGHVNIWGAKKISTYISELLANRYSIGGGEYYEQWSETDQYYQNVVKDCELEYITDFYEYMDAINQERYTIFIAVNHDATRFMTDKSRAKFRENLGIDLDIDQYDSFYAVINDHDITQAHSQNALAYYGSIRDNLVDFAITSAGFEAGDSCSIKINNVEYCKNQEGINIVVYSNDTWKIVDSVVYDYDGIIHR